MSENAAVCCDLSKNKYATQARVSEIKLALPELSYRPARPKHNQSRIALIACGGITEIHLTAYRNAGYDVVAMMDPMIANAKARRDAFYPDADVYDSAQAIWDRPDINVVDIAAHPAHRVPLIEQAIRAGKHVLSQKPFVLDLEVGEQLVKLADDHGVKLAVNQNGRWAPNMSWMRQAINAGLVGNVASVDSHIAWDHTWVQGTAFEHIPHLILFDYAIHGFDMLHSYMPNEQPLQVMAYATTMATQSIRPPLLAQVMVQYEHAQATLVFRAGATAGMAARTLITGDQGTLLSDGPDVNNQKVTLITPEGSASPKLQGAWFPDGMDGTMSELLVAIEEDRQPDNSALDNLKSLAICFAALESADTGKPVKVGDARRVKESWLKYL